MPSTESQIDFSNSVNRGHISRGLEAIAIDCEKVGGGSDGSLDLCARVCLVDEDENIIFHTYVQPQIPVTNYRYLFALYWVSLRYFREGSLISFRYSCKYFQV